MSAIHRRSSLARGRRSHSRGCAVRDRCWRLDQAGSAGSGPGVEARALGEVRNFSRRGPYPRRSVQLATPYDSSWASVRNSVGIDAGAYAAVDQPTQPFKGMLSLQPPYLTRILSVSFCSVATQRPITALGRRSRRPGCKARWDRTTAPRRRGRRCSRCRRPGSDRCAQVSCLRSPTARA